eukprot:TRINITY_DN35586_c0_g1_i1.p1 TRINITY_DN35586_c0_g1~~TRINITY_DN35586_c0_g1_i1.p1  ORF type:complete len:1058 (+),score=381.56 TRINITY_DN35586_c0_g1_i1:65-3175(+)
MRTAARVRRAVPASRWAFQSRNVATGILKEHGAEQRVSMVPNVAAAFIKQGYKLTIEKGAGEKSGFSDSAYAAIGCDVADRAGVISKSELLFGVNPPKEEDLGKLKGKMMVAWVGRLLPAGKAYVEKATAAGVTLVDTTAVPRITTAQKLDVLSSQAKCAGHRAVIEGSNFFTRFYQGEITAAGKYPPCHTMVLGIGVAGLAAMGTSNALGAVVRAWDVRDVSDQVTSMGGKWIKVDFKEEGAGAGGYAKESSPEFQAAQKATFHKHAKEVDIIITTAAIPGRKAPILIEKQMVDDMKAGSVIIDLAAVGGGNCELTKPGEVYTTPNGVTIVGYTDLAGRMGMQASSMYAQNMYNLVTHITGKEGAPAFFENVNKALGAGEEGDIITRSIVCCRDGQAIAMPPPPQPTPVKKKEAKESKGPAKPKYDPAAAATQQSLIVSGTAGTVIGLGAGGEVAATVGSSELVTISMLAGAAGYQAVWGVAHALHTPLMSVTNAISGLTAAGGMMVLGKGGGDFAQYLAWGATSLSVVNIVGGFIVSKRMLDLFKKPGEADQSVKYMLPLGVMVAAPWVADGTLALSNGVSGLFCIGAIGGLANQKTAQFGAALGVCGVAGAMSATTFILPADQLMIAGGLSAAGAVGGVAIGTSVSPMALPQTVAAFHSLVGIAASLTSIASYMIHPAASVGHLAAAVLGNAIGAVTFTGSLVAFGKLNGNLSSAPLNLPGKNMLNVLMAGAQTAIGVYLCSGVDFGTGQALMWGTFALSSVFGLHLVGSVGGGDMPCCITVLNSYSGWALVAEGFLLNSPLLSIVGSLIGFSGAILTKIMCDAMNRDIVNVIFGGMNTVAKKAGDGAKEVKEHRETNTDSVAELLMGAKEVCIVPGYGMAVSRAQSAVADIATTLTAQGINVKFGIHPVAGRMPGQMNVLLAEAGVPYEWVLEMEEVNPDMDNTDVLLVVGANDITNSAALEDEDCSIYGMPVIEVWRAKNCIFMKRSMAAGYADLENPVFFKDNTQMLLGDGRSSCEGIAAALKTKIAASA